MVKQVKQLFTDMLADQYKKLCEPYQAHEKSIADMRQRRRKQLNSKIDKLSA